MIKAYDAYTKTKFQKQIIGFKANIEKAINKAISEGKYECEVQFNCDIPDSVREDISNELVDLGYDCKMPRFVKQPSDIPCDQCRYYDYLKIGWGGDHYKYQWN